MVWKLYTIIEFSISANIGTMNHKVHRIENTIDTMNIEYHLTTECFVNKLNGSFACLLTACGLKLKCSI